MRPGIARGQTTTGEVPITKPEPPPEPKPEPKKPLSAKKKVKLESYVKFGGPYAGGGWVYYFKPDGFYTRPNKAVRPDISVCNFWPWTYVEEHLLEVL
jgi:hypothetical protein